MSAQIRVLEGKNHYRPESYFSLNVKNGVMRAPTGQRMLTMPEDFLTGLHAGLEDETGQAAPVILYTVGKFWGRQFAKNHAQEIRSFYKKDAEELPTAFYLHVLRRAWGLYGWGHLDLSFEHQEHGFIEAIVDGALYSDAVGNVGRTTDHLVAGALASITSHIAGRDLECVEVACKSQGDAQCRFLVGMSQRVDTVSQWVQQKRSASEILASVSAGELD
ncbi:MAG: V4R domain-containing protein [Myxococcota bacterium]